MNCRSYILLLLSLLLFNCDQTISNNSKKKSFSIEKKYSNTGFALIYNSDLLDIKKLENRSLDIYHNSLKKRSIVKIINPKNGKFLMAEVKSNKVKFSSFYNSILSPRIAEELDLNSNEPYIQLILVAKNSTFIAKKAKTFDEERIVAEKAPVDGIQINDLNETMIEKKINEIIFSYSIKVADFYYKDTAISMMNRIKNEASINNLSIRELSKTKYRVLIGPFNDIKTLRDSFEKMNYFKFENLEIIKNV
jgi:hypothetical protein